VESNATPANGTALFSATVPSIGRETVSWDAVIQGLPEGVESVADIPGDFSPSALGRREELIAAILEVFERADFSDPAWGVLDGDDYPSSSISATMTR